MPKFFINSSNINAENNTITISDDTVNHINVLRYKVDDNISFISDNSTEYICQISNITKKEITSKILDTITIKPEFNFKIALYQGLAKGDKMDNIIQKATELGITSITPINTQFTIVKLNEEKRLESKINRWQKIAQEAAIQSERESIPKIYEPISFKEAIKEAKSNGAILFCYGREKSYTIKEFLVKYPIKENETLSIFIGPEGGFSNEEIKLLDENNIETTSLGKSILRTETASLVALSMIKYHYMHI